MDTNKVYSITYSRNSINENTNSLPGYLIISSSRWIWLKDVHKSTIRKGLVDAELISRLERVGATTICAGYRIENLNEIMLSNSGHHETADNSKQLSTSGKVECSLEYSTKKRKHPEISQAKKLDPELDLDNSIKAVLKDHQLEATLFVIKRLLGHEPDANTSVTDKTNIPVTGAILADDMGTGKTLVALSVIWSFCRYGTCKCVVVCPASLIKNWEREINKWFPKNLGRNTLYLTGGQTSESKNARNIILEFYSSHPAAHPLLITSYEMYRSNAEHLHKIRTFDLLVCDEGHRLKNAYGTATGIALGNSCAFRRLVLTGTPLQNNLDELYAVVQLVAPGYLGTLTDFQRLYSKPIENGRKSQVTDAVKKQADIATNALRERLSSILLRRSGDNILRAILPPRHEIIIKCSLSSIQLAEYYRVANKLFGELQNTVSSESATLKISSTETSPLLPDMEVEVEDVVMNSQNLPNTESGDGTILTSLLRLRQICGGVKLSQQQQQQQQQIQPQQQVQQMQQQSVGLVDSLVDNSLSSLEASTAVDNPATSTSTITTTAITTSTTTASSSTASWREKYDSSKIEVLEALLSSIYENKEKVVVTSLFSWTLNLVKQIAIENHWLTLRIDGQVPPAKRQSLVQHFNNPKSPFFIMLLSTKAGGVGLNLTGANRLVLMEPDWNPATDHQAMGRVWRQGQMKEVTIYRLIGKHTIEESILSRQHDKNGLNAVVRTDNESITYESTNNHNNSNNSTDNKENHSNNSHSHGYSGLPTTLSLKGLQSLVFPNVEQIKTASMSENIPVVMEPSSILETKDTTKIGLTNKNCINNSHFTIECLNRGNSRDEVLQHALKLYL